MKTPTCVKLNRAIVQINSAIKDLKKIEGTEVIVNDLKFALAHVEYSEGRVEELNVR